MEEKERGRETGEGRRIEQEWERQNEKRLFGNGTKSAERERERETERKPLPRFAEHVELFLPQLCVCSSMNGGKGGEGVAQTFFSPSLKAAEAGKARS